MTDLFLLHCGVTWALIGLIWTIQIVHYPLFSRVEPTRFVDYHRAHSRRITWLVGPLMLAELGSAVLLVTLGDPSSWIKASLLPLGAVWLSTAAIQVPQHRRLENGYDGRTLRQLCWGNWLRTAAWTARGLLLWGALRET